MDWRRSPSRLSARRSVGWVVAASFIDRIVRYSRALRDALVRRSRTAVTAGPRASASAGARYDRGLLSDHLRQSRLMTYSSDNFARGFDRRVSRHSSALARMVFAVYEPNRHEADIKPRLRFADAKRLSGPSGPWSRRHDPNTCSFLRSFSHSALPERRLPISLVPAVMGDE